MSDPVNTPSLLSKHRIEALVDGIFAITMTLLVIELRLPEHGELARTEVPHAVAALIPTIIAWIISFFVLAIFWVGNHRLLALARHSDLGLVWITILMLAGATLMPFATSLNSQHASPFSQSVYAFVMIWLALSTMLTARHLHRHPELCAHPVTRGAYYAAQVRSGVVVAVALGTVLISYVVYPGMANMAFALLFFVRPLGNRVQAKYDRLDRAAASEPAPAPVQ